MTENKKLSEEDDTFVAHIDDTLVGYVNDIDPFTISQWAGAMITRPVENKKCDNCMIMIECAWGGWANIKFKNGIIIQDYTKLKFKFCPECGHKIEAEHGE